MSEEEENNAQQPPVPPKRPKLFGLAATADAHLWARKWSTQLAVLDLSLKAAGTAFVMGPAEWREGFPAYLGVYLLVGSMLVSALIPIATSIQQKVAK